MNPEEDNKIKELGLVAIDYFQFVWHLYFVYFEFHW